MKRTVIVTGGTKGLGRETALAFGRAGYGGLALYSADEAAAGELTMAMATMNISGCAVRHDVCSEDPSVWNRPEIETADHLTLVNNACANFSPAPIHQLAWPEFERSFLVSVKGAWSCSLGLIRHMVRRKQGAIVNVLTAATEGLPPKGFAAYVTAKHALHGFTLALAVEYATRGVKIFSVSPGYMETSLTRQWDDRWREAIRSNSTRITVPAEAAARILELVENSAVPGCGENHSL
jgi:NAD(P)-dependent dehydrogenase (short-subunit alcohol dehydrogenase family)